MWCAADNQYVAGACMECTFSFLPVVSRETFNSNPFLMMIPRMRWGAKILREDDIGTVHTRF